MLYSILLILIVFILSVNPVNAVTTTISNLPHLISNDPFTFKVTISGAAAGTNYLRIDLYKPSTANYFGETFNGLDWYSENDPALYYLINLETGTDWSGVIQGRTGMPTLTQYDGPGAYKIRIRRYTSSGNYNSTEANNSSTDIQINIQTADYATATNPGIFLEPTITQQPVISNNSFTATNTLTPQQTANIFLSEVLADPESGSNEWVEIYNYNGTDIVITDWFIDDLENSGGAPKKFSLTLPAKSYFAYDISSSFFNNSGDSVRLLDQDGKEVDSFQYGSSRQNNSLGRTGFDNDSYCLQSPTKNKANGPCLNPSQTITKTVPTVIPTATLISLPTVTASPVIYITVTPFRLSPQVMTQQEIPEETEAAGNKILGLSTKNNKNENNVRGWVSFLSFNAAVYPVLSIISVLFKLKRFS